MKCPHCPILTEDRECPGQKNSRVCYRAESNPAIVANLIASRPAVVHEVLPAVASQLALIAGMKACPSWVASSECGCGANQCLLGKGRGGIVAHDDCFVCLRDQCA